MSERIEHELNQIATCQFLIGNVVDVVRPGFGSQSDSWCGYLTVVGSGYPIRFQFQHPAGCILFTADDVIKIDQPKDTTDEREKHLIVRLKGPQDYGMRPVLTSIR